MKQKPKNMHKETEQEITVIKKKSNLKTSQHKKFMPKIRDNNRVSMTHGFRETEVINWAGSIIALFYSTGALNMLYTSSLRVST